VKSIATMAIKIAVTTWPCAVSLTIPNAGMGAVGWMTTIP
jgi:hypothetical protein